MSRERVITGTDERGRPTSRWADPEPAAGEAYGFMEPAHVSTIERRKATPQELEAARAREADPTHLTVASIAKPPVAVTRSDAHMQASRMNGAARHVEVMAARRAAPEPTALPEEEIVSEPRAEDAEPIPARPPNPLSVLAVAAEKAALARDEYVLARTAWDEALAALVAAWGNAGVVVETIVPAELVQDLETAPVDVPAGSARTNTGGGPGRGLTSNEERVLAATIAHDGDRKAVARELGMTAAINVEQSLERIGKKGLLPSALIPKLPARFAKYAGATS